MKKCSIGNEGCKTIANLMTLNKTVQSLRYVRTNIECYDILNTPFYIYLVLNPMKLDLKDVWLFWNHCLLTTH